MSDWGTNPSALLPSLQLRRSGKLRREGRGSAEIAEGARRICSDKRPEAERWLQPASHGGSASSPQKPGAPSRRLKPALPEPLTKNPGPSTGLELLLKVPLRKGKAGPAFEVELEPMSQLACVEGKVALHFPRPVFRRVRRFPVVVHFQPPLQIIRVPDVAPPPLQAFKNVGVEHRRQNALDSRKVACHPQPRAGKPPDALPSYGGHHPSPRRFALAGAKGGGGEGS